MANSQFASFSPFYIGKQLTELVARRGSERLPTLDGECSGLFCLAIISVPYPCHRYTYTNLGIASLEGALLIARLERNDEALRDAKDHLHGYIEAEIRNHERGKPFLYISSSMQRGCLTAAGRSCPGCDLAPVAQTPHGHHPTGKSRRSVLPDHRRRASRRVRPGPRRFSRVRCPRISRRTVWRRQNR